MRTVPCPTCGAAIALDAHICLSCEVQKPALKVCPACGGIMSETAYECPRCGHVVVPWGNRSKWFLMAAQVIALPVLIALGAIILYGVTILMIGLN